MKETKPFIPYCDLSVYPVSIGFTSDPTKFYKELERRGLPHVDFIDNDAISTTHAIMGEFCHVVIIVLDKTCKEFKDLYTGLMVHEAVHAWQYIKEAIGEDKAGDEIEAYTVQHITEFLIDELSKGK